MNLQYILILVLLLLATLYSSFGLSQEIRDEKVKHFKEIVLRKDFKSLYEKQLRRVRRVYPLALEAAKMIENLDEELDDQESKRGKRKKIKFSPFWEDQNPVNCHQKGLRKKEENIDKNNKLNNMQ